MKSTWAIVAGILFLIVVTTIVDVVQHIVGCFPPLGVRMDDIQPL